MQEKNINNLGERLKTELSPRGKIARAAEVLGKSRNTLTNWCASGNIPAAELQRLGDAGIVDAAYVMTGNRSAGAGAAVSEAPAAYGPGGDPEFVAIPEYDIEVAAGNGRVVLNDEPVGKWHFRRDWLRAEGLEGKRLITVIARGDSGEPKISDGDMLLVDRDINAIDRDGVYVVGLRDHLVVKRVARRFDQPGLTLSSNNELYPPIELDASTAEQLTVVGRVERVVRLGRP